MGWHARYLRPGTVTGEVACAIGLHFQRRLFFLSQGQSLYYYPLLSQGLRSPSEFFLYKQLDDAFLSRAFDARGSSSRGSGATFGSIQRASDVWDWGRQVLLPGLLDDASSCPGDTRWPPTVPTAGPP